MGPPQVKWGLFLSLFPAVGSLSPLPGLPCWTSAGEEMHRSLRSRWPRVGEVVLWEISPNLRRRGRGDGGRDL